MKMIIMLQTFKWEWKSKRQNQKESKVKDARMPRSTLWEIIGDFINIKRACSLI